MHAENCHSYGTTVKIIDNIDTLYLGTRHFFFTFIYGGDIFLHAHIYSSIELCTQSSLG